MFHKEKNARFIPVPVMSNPCCSNMEPFIYALLYSPALSAFIGAASAITATFVTEKLQRHRLGKSELEQKLANVRSTRDEINFYIGKFEKLQGDLLEARRNISLGGKHTVPSYDFSPAYLEQCRIALGISKDLGTLTLTTGHCQFELSHIQGRLRHTKLNLFSLSPSDPDMQKRSDCIEDISGLVALLDLNIDSFKECQERADGKITELERLVGNYDITHFPY
jgi:hypothetical protein